MPKDLFQQLRKVWVVNKQLEISLVNNNEASSDGDAPRRKSKRSGKPRNRARDQARRPSQNRN